MTWDETVKAYQEEVLKLQLEEAQCRRTRAQIEMLTAEQTYERSKTANRPSVLYGATLKKTGDRWVASSQGVFGYGDTPEEATAEYDRAWKTKVDTQASRN